MGGWDTVILIIIFAVLGLLMFNKLREPLTALFWWIREKFGSGVDRTRTAATEVQQKGGTIMYG